MCGGSKIVSLALPWGTVAWLTMFPLSQPWVCGEGARGGLHLLCPSRERGFWLPVQLCPPRTDLFLHGDNEMGEQGASALSARWDSAWLAGTWLALGQAAAGCNCRMALKDYTGIKLSKGLFHTHNGVKYAAWFWWEKMIDWVRIIDNNFGADFCSGGLVKQGAVMTSQLPPGELVLKPDVFLGPRSVNLI